MSGWVGRVPAATRGHVVHFSRFTAVGAAGLAVNQALFWLITSVEPKHYLVAAVVATIGSTTFNFAGIESWVFRGRRQPGFGGLARRYAAYGGVNGAALLFRLPLLYVLVQWIHMPSLWGNLLTLVALTLVRFAVSDRLIWPGKQTISAEAQ
jgi:putative flippase GtrA